jgi:hypothetical protein
MGDISTATTPDRISHLHQGLGSFFIQPSHPGSDRGRGDQHVSRGLRHRPASGGSKLEDGQPFDGRVVRSPLSRDSQHPGILDAHLLLKQRHLLPESVVLLLK